jgi:hypothetical protein
MKGKIFTAQEVQAIIAGNKTMFREICKRQPQGEIEKPYVIRQAGITEFNYPFGKIPYQVGQKIFVKESWHAFTSETLETPLGKMRIYSYPAKKGDIIECKADTDLTKDFTSYLPSTTMPKWASRLTLQIKEIRVESLLDIREDCYKEGIDYSPECCQNYIDVDDWNENPTPSCCNNPNLEDPRPAFAENWNATYKKPEEKFEANPFVWVIQFDVVK